MKHHEKPNRNGTAKANQRPPTISQRAMFAAQRMKDLATVSGQRQWAGAKAPDGTKGKASAQAASEEGVGTRTAELARLVLRACDREVVAAVESGLLTVSAAAKLAKKMPGVQRQVVGEVAKGRPVVEVLAEAGAQDRRLPRFDNDVFEKLAIQFKRLLNLRRYSLGDHPSYHVALARQEELLNAVRQWTLSGLQGPPPTYTRYGRPLPVRVNEAFQFRGQFEDTMHDLDSLSRRIGMMARRDGGQCIPAKYIARKLEEVSRLLWGACPHHVCTCWGDSPTHAECGGRGWMPLRPYQDPNPNIDGTNSHP